MATYSDNFNRTNGAPGSDWTSVNSGTWAIASNVLQQTNTSYVYRGLRWAGGAFAGNDIYARATVRIPTGAAAYTGIGILVRCPTSGTDANAVDGYSIVGFVTDEWYRIELADGVDDYTAIGGTCAYDTNYTIEVRAEGSTITVYLNSTQLAQWTDTTYASGGAMLLSYGGTVTFDNFEAGDLGATTSVPAEFGRELHARGHANLRR